jgi:hypothetical protein
VRTQAISPLDRWAYLSVDQLLGAEYALRLLRTSPRIRGTALELVDDLIAQAGQAIVEREQAAKATA